MESTRWQKIEELFNATLALPADERAPFLDTACGSDHDLRKELDSLLSEVDEGVDFLSQPAFTLGERVLTHETESLTGKTLGVYTILNPIGRGGMGEVFLAEDSRLERFVALKILPASFAGKSDSASRFQQEARAASAISHPNVAHIYEIGTFDDRHFIAMEYVEGVTLRQRLTKRDLSLGEAIDIATQMANALAATHALGIIHRDIKPENILVRHDGLVKVVDFGLAKLTESHRAFGSSDNRETRSGAPITPANQTLPGILMGTATYMSPEQARGQEIDERTDIWSWGVVFYEMLKGFPPFRGPTTSDVIAEILKTEPSFSENHIRELPHFAIEILRRSLSKDKNERYPSILILTQALTELGRDLSEKGLLELPLPIDESTANVMVQVPENATSRLRRLALPGPAISRRWASRLSKLRGKRLFYLFAVAATSLIVVVLLLSKSGLIYRSIAIRAPSALEITQLTRDGGILDAAISPDSHLLAFVAVAKGKQSLRIRNLESGENWELLPPDPALYWGPRFSPNSQSLFYVTKQPGSTINVLYRVPVYGGPPEKVVVNIDDPPALSPDGMQIAFVRGYPGQHRDALIVANVDGSAEREILSRQHPDKLSFSGCAWSPDGKLVAAGASRRDETELAVLGVPVNGGPAIEITPWQWIAVRGAIWENDGHTLLFSAQSIGTDAVQLWRVSYPEKVITPVTNDDRQYEEITLGQNALITTAGYEVANLWSSDQSGRSHLLTTNGLNGTSGLAITASGRIVYTVGDYQRSQLWIMNLDGSDRKLLTQNSGVLPSTSRDGRQIAYVSAAGGAHHIWLVDIDGQNNRQLTFGDGENNPSLTPHGDSVVYVTQAKNRGTLWRIPITGGQPVQMTFGGIVRNPVVSPDGTKIACTYRMDEADRWKIAILPFQGGRPLNTFAMPYPFYQIIRWTPDSKALTYLDKVNGVQNVWRQPLDGSPASKITDFNEDLILYYSLPPSRQLLILSRGGRKRDVVLIRNFK